MKNNKKFLLLFIFSAFLICSFLTACNGLNRFSVEYSAGVGGYIQGNTNQSVVKGKDAETVTAVPNDGYEFSYWSDGYPTAERTDLDVTEKMTATAYFERAVFNVTYKASVGGKIKGEANQTVQKGKDATKVVAFPDEGYIFSYWSDYNYSDARMDAHITKDLTITAYFEKTNRCVTYNAGPGGHIDGEPVQVSKTDEYTSEVTAVADRDYEFEKWSDGYTEATRSDIMDGNKNFTAYFKQVSKTLNYNYNNATKNNTVSQVTIRLDADLDTVKLVVPERINSIFEGWYADKTFKAQVSDENGNITIGEKIFDAQNLYAKFRAIEEINYKILMVYVTEKEGENKISDSFTELFDFVTDKFEEKLNEIFAGLVNFEVDIDFATEYVSENEETLEYTNALKEKFDGYRNVIISTVKTYGLSNFSFGGNKFGYYEWDSLTETQIDNLKREFRPVIEDYLEKFISSISKSLKPEPEISFSDSVKEFINTPEFKEMPEVEARNEIAKRFLLNLLEKDGNALTTVPYEFWKGKVTVNFVAEQGGTIDGQQSLQFTLSDSEKRTVTAAPSFGYTFIKWKTPDWYFSDNDLYSTTFTYKNNYDIYYNQLTITAHFAEVQRDIYFGSKENNSLFKNFKKRFRYTVSELIDSPLWIPENQFGFNEDGEYCEYVFEGWSIWDWENNKAGKKVTSSDGMIFEDCLEYFTQGDELLDKLSLYASFSKKPAIPESPNPDWKMHFYLYDTSMSEMGQFYGSIWELTNSPLWIPENYYGYNEDGDYCELIFEGWYIRDEQDDVQTVKIADSNGTLVEENFDYFIKYYGKQYFDPRYYNLDLYANFTPISATPQPPYPGLNIDILFYNADKSLPNDFAKNSHYSVSDLMETPLWIPENQFGYNENDVYCEFVFDGWSIWDWENNKAGEKVTGSDGIIFEDCLEYFIKSNKKPPLTLCASFTQKPTTPPWQGKIEILFSSIPDKTPTPFIKSVTYSVSELQSAPLWVPENQLGYNEDGDYCEFVFDGWYIWDSKISSVGEKVTGRDGMIFEDRLEYFTKDSKGNPLYLCSSFTPIPTAPLPPYTGLKIDIVFKSIENSLPNEINKSLTYSVSELESIPLWTPVNQFGYNNEVYCEFVFDGWYIWDNVNNNATEKITDSDGFILDGCLEYFIKDNKNSPLTLYAFFTLIPTDPPYSAEVDILFYNADKSLPNDFAKYLHYSVSDLMETTLWTPENQFGYNEDGEYCEFVFEGWYFWDWKLNKATVMVTDKDGKIIEDLFYYFTKDYRDSPLTLCASFTQKPATPPSPTQEPSPSAD